MTQATVLNSAGTSFTVTNTVLNSAGTGFAVNANVLNAAGSSFLVFTSAAFTTSVPASRTCTNPATDRSNSISATSRTCVNPATDRTTTV